MKKKVLNFGSLNLDYVYLVDHILQPGETLSAINRQVFCGGKGLNQSVALVRANIIPYHAGNIGEDGAILMQFLKDNGVDVRFLNQVPGNSGHTIIQVNQHAQNCILVYGAANRNQDKNYIDFVLDNFEKDDYILLQNEINELNYIIDKAHKKGMKIILNPSPFDEHLLSCDLNKVSVFVLNELEGEAITGYNKPLEILSGMRCKFPKSIVLLTLGDKGAYYSDENTVYFQEIYPTKAVDTTAAGDTFTGYFIAGLIDELSIEYNMKRCAKAASITVSKEGAAQSIPTLEEVLEG